MAGGPAGAPTPPMSPKGEAPRRLDCKAGGPEEAAAADAGAGAGGATGPRVMQQQKMKRKMEKTERLPLAMERKRHGTPSQSCCFLPVREDRVLPRGAKGFESQTKKKKKTRPRGCGKKQQRKTRSGAQQAFLSPLSPSLPSPRCPSLYCLSCTCSRFCLQALAD